MYRWSKKYFIYWKFLMGCSYKTICTPLIEVLWVIWTLELNYSWFTVQGKFTVLLLSDHLKVDQFNIKIWVKTEAQCNFQSVTLTHRWKKLKAFLAICRSGQNLSVKRGESIAVIMTLSCLKRYYRRIFLLHKSKGITN